MSKDLHIVFISNDWREYHRKDLTEALIKGFGDQTQWLIVNLPISISVHLFTNFKKKFLEIFSKKKRNINLQNNAILFTPVIFSHFLLWGKIPLAYNLDAFLIRSQLKKFYKKFLDCRKILWLFIPEVPRLSNDIKHDKLVYDFYDNYSYHENGEIDEKRKAVNENLMSKSDVVICTAKFLYEQALSVNKNSYYVPNAGNYGVLSNVSEKNQHEKKYVGYLGGIRDWIDFKLIEYLLKEMKEHEFLFIGKIYVSAEKDFKRLLDNYTNLKHIGFTGHKELIKILDQFKVAIIPFRNNKFFDAVLPYKFFEYMSMGIPIICTNMPALSDYKNIIGYSTSYEEFKNNCLKFINSDNTELSKAYKKIASENSWEDRVKEIKGIITKI